jgi:hypothetical protein
VGRFSRLNGRYAAAVPTSAFGRKQTAAIGHKEATAALADKQSFPQTTILFRIWPIAVI